MLTNNHLIASRNDLTLILLQSRLRIVLMPRPRPPSNRGHVAMLKSGSMMLDWKTGQLLNYKIVFFSLTALGLMSLSPAF